MGGNITLQPKYLRALELRLEGKTTREIAKELFGDETKINRVRDYISYAIRRLGLDPLLLCEAYPQIKKDNDGISYWSGNIIEIKKRVKDKKTRQLITHEQMIYYILKRLGFNLTDLVVQNAKYFHYKYFFMFYEKYGDNLRCWRNGGKRLPFSFTIDSLAYVLGIVQGVLLLNGYVYKISELNELARTLIPSRKRNMIYQFYVSFADIGGQVLGRILLPHL